MIWVALIIGVVLVLVLQLRASEKDLQAIHADHCPDNLLTEPDVPISISVTLQNNSRRLIPFAAVRS